MIGSSTLPPLVLDMEKLATAVSLILAPQLYGGFIAYVLWVHYRAGGHEALLVLLLTQTILPLLPILIDTARGKIDIFVTERKKRWKYYILTLLSYVVGLVYIVDKGLWIYFPFYASYMAIAAVMALITLKWKISVHTAGIAGPTTALVYLVGLEKAYLYLLLIPVAWARYRLKAHTVSQLVAGALLATVLTVVICGATVSQ